MRILLASSLVLIAIAISLAAIASPSCLTKREARAHYPRAHLYWHGRGRCWDDKGRTRGPSKKRDRGPLYAVVVAGPTMVQTIAVVYRPLMILPDPIDAFMRFPLWEQRVAGSF